MKHDPEMVKAQEAMRTGEWARAISVLTEVAKDKHRKAAASMGLGIVYSGENEFYDPQLAIEHYQIAESAGYTKATYGIAGLLQESGKIEEALSRFKKIAATNPSAAYWCYRIIKTRNLEGKSNEDFRIFMKLAADSGHVLAKREDIFERLGGRDGIGKIPRAFIDLFRWFVTAKSAVASGNKMLFQ